MAANIESEIAEMCTGCAYYVGDDPEFGCNILTRAGQINGLKKNECLNRRVLIPQPIAKVEGKWIPAKG